MLKKQIKISPYEENNIHLMIHIGKMNGVYVDHSKKNVVLYALTEQSLDRFLSEWERKYNELFIYCERYKMLKLPHFKLARSKYLTKLINTYSAKYLGEYKLVVKELRSDTKI